MLGLQQRSNGSKQQQPQQGPGSETAAPEQVRANKYGSGRQRKKLAALEARLSVQLDSEDKRVKELTEGVLYHFLPAALRVMLPQCEDPSQELDADKCRAVASAALAVSALMNAPPGFLEFLLCVPWRKLSQLYPKSDSIDKLVSHLHVTEDERRTLVNTPIDSALMPTILDFLLRDEHRDSVPPLLNVPRHTPPSQLGPDVQSQPTSEMVAALLDGATPLHCAALRGNPAQVDHLLFCGADPTIRTAAGELPIELVPVCGDSVPGSSKRVCRCMQPTDQEVWECRSRLARSLIARRCMWSFHIGLFAWLRLLIFCLLCLLGHAGRYTSIVRPLIERHVVQQRDARRLDARARSSTLMERMRAESDAGHAYLLLAKRENVQANSLKGPPTIHDLSYQDPTQPPPSLPPPPNIRGKLHDLNLHIAGVTDTPGGPPNITSDTDRPSEGAFRCFVRAVHALQSLDLQSDTVPHMFSESAPSIEAESRETHVLEDEQADLYCCWAESVLFKFRDCMCLGCAALAAQAVHRAHLQATKLLARLEGRRQSHADRWLAVGQALVRIVYAHVCLLLETEARVSPTRASVWRAEQCLKEWHRLEQLHLVPQADEHIDKRLIHSLQLWAKTADSDLYLAEALQGSPLSPNQTLAEVVAVSVIHAPSGEPCLSRPVTAELVQQLDQAITLACHPSPALANTVKAVAAHAAEELAAATRLRDLVNPKASGPGSSSQEAIEQLTAAIQIASHFGRLTGEVEAARLLLDRWLRRTEAVERLESVVESVRQYVAMHPLCLTSSQADSSTSSAMTSRAASLSSPLAVAADCTSSTGSSSTAEAAAGGSSSCSTGSRQDLLEWEAQMKLLEAAAEDAKDANISVTKAKRLLKEMHAAAVAADAARQLELVLAKRPAGPGAVKAALARAETAASVLGSLSSSVAQLEPMAALTNSGRRRLEVEKAAEALHRAANTCRSLSDLAKLEAAILNAKKVGAEELDPDSYKAASELRLRLAEAARTRQHLEASVKALPAGARMGKIDEAEAVAQRAIQEACKWGDLLAADVHKARESIEDWRNQAASVNKLERALRDGAGTAALSRAIQEASAAGVKVNGAKRVLKLMQALESAMAGTEGVGGQLAEQIKARLEAAEQGGVSSQSMLQSARRRLRELAVAAARESLEAALKPHSDWSDAQRISALRTALDRALEVVGPLPPQDACPGGNLDSKMDHLQAKTTDIICDGKDDTDAALHDIIHDVGEETATGSSDQAAVGAVAKVSLSDATASTGCSSPRSDTSTSQADRAEAADKADKLHQVAVVHELARRALALIEEDDKARAALEAERQAAERARKEAAENERKERAKAEQERQKHDQADQTEPTATDKRDRIAAAPDKLREELVVDEGKPSAKAGKAGKKAKAVASSPKLTNAMPPSTTRAADPLPLTSAKLTDMPPPPPPPRVTALAAARTKAAPSTAAVAVSIHHAPVPTNATLSMPPAADASAATPVASQPISAVVALSDAAAMLQREPVASDVDIASSSASPTAAAAAMHAARSHPVRVTPSVLDTLGASSEAANAMCSELMHLTSAISPCAPAPTIPSPPLTPTATKPASMVAEEPDTQAAAASASALLHQQSPVEQRSVAASRQLSPFSMAGSQQAAAAALRQDTSIMDASWTGPASVMDSLSANRLSVIDPSSTKRSSGRSLDASSAGRSAISDLSLAGRSSLLEATSLIPSPRPSPAHARGDSIESLSRMMLHLSNSNLETLSMFEDTLGPVDFNAPHLPAFAPPPAYLSSIWSSSLPNPLTATAAGTALIPAATGDVSNNIAADLQAASFSTNADASASTPLERTPSQPSTSRFSSATSTEDALGYSHEPEPAAATAGTGGLWSAPSAQLQPQVMLQPKAAKATAEVSKSSSTDATADAADEAADKSAQPAAPPPPKFKFEFVDLGGASWGLDAGVGVNTSSAAQASLFPQLQTVRDFNSLISSNDAKVAWPAPASAAAAAAIPPAGQLDATASDSSSFRQFPPLQFPSDSATAWPMPAAAGGHLQSPSPAGHMPATASASVAAGQFAPGLLSGLPPASSGPMLRSAVAPQGQAATAAASRVGFWLPPGDLNASADFPVSASAAPLQQQHAMVSMLKPTVGMVAAAPVQRMVPMSDWQGHDGGQRTSQVPDWQAQDGVQRLVQMSDWQAQDGMLSSSMRTTRLCKFFLNGFCREGERCRFIHPTTLGTANAPFPTASGAMTIPAIHANGVVLSKPAASPAAGMPYQQGIPTNATVQYTTVPSSSAAMGSPQVLIQNSPALTSANAPQNTAQFAFSAAGYESYRHDSAEYSNTETAAPSLHGIMYPRRSDGTPQAMGAGPTGRSTVATVPVSVLGAGAQQVQPAAGVGTHSMAGGAPGLRTVQLLHPAALQMQQAAASSTGSAVRQQVQLRDPTTGNLFSAILTVQPSGSAQISGLAPRMHSPAQPGGAAPVMAHSPQIHIQQQPQAVPTFHQPHTQASPFSYLAQQQQQQQPTGMGYLGPSSASAVGASTGPPATSTSSQQINLPDELTFSPIMSPRSSHNGSGPTQLPR